MVPNDGTIALSGSRRRWVSGAVLGAWLRGRLKSLLKPRGCGEGVRMSAARCQYCAAVSDISFTSQFPPAPRGRVPRDLMTFSNLHGVVFLCANLFIYCIPPSNLFPAFVFIRSLGNVVLPVVSTSDTF